MFFDQSLDDSKLTRASRVSNQLRAEIISGKLAPGSKVNLDHLRDIYNVSLSPMREAISRLVAERLVEFEDKKGFRIMPIGMANLLEITRMRADLESLALKHAITIGTLDWESRVPAAIYRLTNSENELFSNNHAAFHAALIRGCAMPMLGDLCKLFANLHHRYSNILEYTAEGRDLNSEHAAIADAAIARDAELGPMLLSRHIERTGNDLADLLETRNNSANGGKNV